MGLVVLIEGCDGAGKSSVIPELEKRLSNVKTFFDPGISNRPEHSNWQTIRNFVKTEQMDSRTELLMFFALRSELMVNVVNAKNNGYVAIMDRGHVSSIVYQGILKGQSELIENLEKIINFPKPDLTFILSAPFDVINDRLEKRFTSKNANMDKFKASKDFRFKVWSEYENYIKHNESIIRIDANRPLSDIVEDIKGDILVKLNIEKKQKRNIIK